MKNIKQTFIDFALKHQILRFGEFTLKSGRISPYFFNLGLIHSGKALQQLSYFYANTLMSADIGFDYLFGPAYKGIPLACATAMTLAEQFDIDCQFAYNRKESKQHGEGGVLVGGPLSGQVVIIDDVITAGTAIRQAIQLINDTDASISAILIALDRQERGQGETSAIMEIQQQLNVPIISLITLDDILSYLTDKPDRLEYHEKIQAYREQYGV